MQLILLGEPVWIKICRKIDEISRKVLITGVIGYDSIRKHLAVCVMNTVEIREKCHPYGCVHRKLEDMPDEGRRSKNYELQRKIRAVDER